MRAAQSLGGLWVVSLLLGCASQVAPLTDGGATTGATSGGVTAGVSGTGGTGGATAGVSSGSGTGGATSGVTSSGGITGGTNSTGGGTTSGVAGTTGGTGGTSGDGGLLNQPCSVDNGIDPCVAVGLVCLYSMDPAHMGTVCMLPGEFYPCQVSVGCNDPALQCLSFFSGSYCLRPCSSTDDCPTLYTNCQSTGSAMACYLNYCTASTDGTFTTCDAGGSGDGTCLPTTGGALCLQGGTAAAGDACSDHRGSGITSADLCTTNASCIPGGIAGAGHCAPLCGIDAGPSCPTPTFCQPSGSGDWGYCL
jgi:hypothetical protein